jgi:hypothetical protein
MRRVEFFRNPRMTTLSGGLYSGGCDKVSVCPRFVIASESPTKKFGVKIFCGGFLSQKEQYQDHVGYFSGPHLNKHNSLTGSDMCFNFFVSSYSELERVMCC